MAKWVFKEEEVDGVLVCLEDPDVWTRLRHAVLSVVAWLWMALSLDSNPDAPNTPYRLVYRDAVTNEVLHDDGVFRGQWAFDAFEEAVEQLDRLGASDFLFKKQHRWRID